MEGLFAMGIYVVVAVGNGRAVVIASSAQKAAEKGSELLGLDEALIEVGRLGTYDPGIEAARLVHTSIVAIQRDAARA